ncbi:MAG: carboxypeptidase regulatory-like domain-containing protein [Chitinivibrionia bacterium]|nr:carboxypeptidase regulatory-like domain-containing protein [Chitinivibrionia bacterium]
MKKILFITFLAAVLGLSAIAHATTYTISGSVKDSSTNRGIPAATVTVRNGSDVVVATLSTDQAGNFTLPVAATGDYYASAVKTGYADFSPPAYPVGISDVSPNGVFNVILTPALSLVAGWNFISFPKDPSPNNSVAHVLGEVSTKVRIVWGYDNVAKRWLKYIPGVADPTLARIEGGLGYWVYMDAPGAIAMTGWAEPPAAITLNAAGNLVGDNGTGNGELSAALNGIFNNYSIIWNWTNGNWYAHPANGRSPLIPDLTVFEQQKAYWINAKAGGTWVYDVDGRSRTGPAE